MPEVVAQPPKPHLTTASRLVSGGLSFLLVLALALASGVPTGQLLATVTSGVGEAGGGLERAVAPQAVERRSVRRQQERPDVGRPAGTVHRASEGEIAVAALGGSIRSAGPLLREALLALPPPSTR